MSDRRETMITEATKWMKTPYLSGGDTSSGIDCSHLVKHIIQAIEPGYAYKTVSEICSSPEFIQVVATADQPRKGDFVSWSDPQHIALIVDPGTGDFIGAQSSTGVAKSNYKTNPYWSARPGMIFLRYSKADN